MTPWDELTTILWNQVGLNRRQECPSVLRAVWLCAVSFDAAYYKRHSGGARK
jgi:hypothetical protein